MEKLNNEELQSVSAGVYSSGIPTLHDAGVALINHGGHCQFCKTPVSEFDCGEGPDEESCPDTYDFFFHCKCPWPLNRIRVTYSATAKQWIINSTVVN